MDPRSRVSPVSRGEWITLDECCVVGGTLHQKSLLNQNPFKRQFDTTPKNAGTRAGESPMDRNEINSSSNAQGMDSARIERSPLCSDRRAYRTRSGSSR